MKNKSTKKNEVAQGKDDFIRDKAKEDSMLNAKKELYLNMYYTIDGIIGRHIEDKKEIFDKLYSICLLPEKDRDRLSELLMRDEVREVTTYSDFAQIRRIKSYSYFTNRDDGISDEVEAIIAVKGNMLKDNATYGYDDFATDTEVGVCKKLTESARKGVIFALCTLGFMQSEGILVDKNNRFGVKNFERAAKWNSLSGILLALNYDEQRRSVNLDRLYTITRGSAY